MSAAPVHLDDLPIGRFHLKIAGLTFGAHFTDGYVLGLIGVAFPLLDRELGLGALAEGLVGASTLIGLFLGSLVFGWLSDRIGRQKVFRASFLLITAASVLQLFARDAAELSLCRVLIGVGLGGDYSVGHAMLAEIAPRRHRGVLLGSFSVIWTIGYVAATMLGAALIGPGEVPWRWLLASSAIPAAAILIGRIGTPESPRWLVQRGRVEEAQAIVRRCFGPDVVLEPEATGARHGGYRVLFSATYRKRTAFNCLFFVCLVMPYFAIYTFLPMILADLGIEDAMAAELVLNGTLIIGALVGIWWTLRFTRRGFLINSLAFLAVALLALAVLPAAMTSVMVLVFGAFTLVLSAVSNLVGVFPAETFPTEVRASGVGLATAVSRLGSATSTFLLPITLAECGVGATMALLAAILAVGAAVSWAWAPETKALSLTAAGRATAPG